MNPRPSLRKFELADGRTLRFDYRDQAEETHPPVVFVNGLSQTTVAWGLQVRRLAGVRNTLTYDAAGQGESSLPPEGSRPEDHADDLVQLLAYLGLERVDLVGFSFGGRVSLRLALRQPDLVRRLVLAGCAHRETAVRRWIVKGWYDALESGGMDRLFRLVTPMVLGEGWLSKNERQQANMLRAFKLRNDPEGVRRLLLDTLLPDGGLSEKQVGSIDVPTLVMRGADDLVVSRALNEELARWLPDGRYVEGKKSGHSIAIERPSWFAGQLLAHIR